MSKVCSADIFRMEVDGGKRKASGMYYKVHHSSDDEFSLHCYKMLKLILTKCIQFVYDNN